MITLLRRVRESLSTGFWAVPTACVTAALVLALVLVAVDRAIEDDLGRFTFGAGPDGAREVLSAMTTSMITFTGLVFSITIVVLQLTSSQFSPRVLRTFLRDRLTQYALGVFVATFVYAVMVLRTVRSGEGEQFVPAVATTVGLGLLLVSVAMFVIYINHIARAIQVSHIIASIGNETRSLLERRMPRDQLAGPGADVLLQPASRTVCSRRNGVVTSVDERGLVQAAREAGVVLVLRPRLGGYLPEGAPLLDVHGETDDLDERALARRVATGRERLMDQDVAFGFRQLVDISEKALSPGLNDPTTAVQALDELHDLLRRLATRQLPDGVHRDENGVVRLITHQEHFADYLDLALDEVEHYGRDSLQVDQKVRAMLEDLMSVALRENQRPLVERWARRDDRARS